LKDSEKDKKGPRWGLQGRGGKRQVSPPDLPTLPGKGRGVGEKEGA